MIKPCCQPGNRDSCRSPCDCRGTGNFLCGDGVPGRESMGPLWPHRPSDSTGITTGDLQLGPSIPYPYGGTVDGRTRNPRGPTATPGVDWSTPEAAQADDVQSGRASP